MFKKMEEDFPVEKFTETIVLKRLWQCDKKIDHPYAVKCDQHNDQFHLHSLSG